METQCHSFTEDTVVFNVLDSSSTPFNGAVCDKCSPRKDYIGVKNLIISFHLFEFGFSLDYVAFIKESLDYISQSNIFPNLTDVYILYSRDPMDLDEIVCKYNIKKIKINYFLLRSRFTNQYCKNFHVLDWEPNNEKALFLVGDPFRFNRLPVIYEFYKRNKLDILDYSLHPNYIHSLKYGDFNEFITSNKHNIDFYSELLTEGDSVALIDFLYTNQKSMDTSTTNCIFESSAYTIPNQLFQSSLTLCMETYFFGIPNSDNIFSEKFWKTVLCKKPFILSSLNDHYYHALEKLGFRTFLEYTSVPKKIDIGVTDFQEIITVHTQVTYDRTTSFLDNMKIYKNEIKSDIEHNHSLWKQLVDSEWEKLLNDCPPLQNLNILFVNSMFLLAQGHSIIFNKKANLNTFLCHAPVIQ